MLPSTVSLDRFHPESGSSDLPARFALPGRTVLMTLSRLDAGERYKKIDEVLEVADRVVFGGRVDQERETDHHRMPMRS